MIPTVSTTVITPTLTPRIVSPERTLLVRNVSTAIQADSFTPSNFMICRGVPLWAPPFFRNEGGAHRGTPLQLFLPQGFDGVETGGAPGRPESKDHPHD